MKVPFRTALIWSALSGFLALSWEIVWARVFNFASGSRAPVFGYMLSSYLMGLALGSLWSRRWQRFLDGNHLSAPARLADLVMRGNNLAFAVAPLTALLAWLADWQWGYALVLISGAMLGIVLPLVCHLAIDSSARSGEHVSFLYLANILGSGAGSLLTGFVFMEWLGIHALSLMLLVCAWAWARSIASDRRPWRPITSPLLVVLLTMGLFSSLYERLQYKHDYRNRMRFANIVESRHGVITVDTNRCVYGNGAYDGVIETKVEPGSWLVRPYFLSAVRDKIENVLVIGVASGAWTQILANHPQVKHVTAIELSHGYLELIAKYPEVKSLLTNPKVEIVIDDGRRWLRRNPDKKFDAIVMNTTHHWREFASALLSKEFLTLVQSHLTPEGIAFWNCTDSLRAAKTGVEVFPHSIMVINHLLASNAPLTPTLERWAKALSQYQIDAKPVFADEKTLNEVLDFVNHEGLPREGDKWKWTNHEHVLELVRDAEVITDDNLGHEYR